MAKVGVTQYKTDSFNTYEEVKNALLDTFQPNSTSANAVNQLQYITQPDHPIHAYTVDATIIHPMLLN